MTLQTSTVTLSIILLKIKTVEAVIIIHNETINRNLTASLKFYILIFLYVENHAEQIKSG